MMKKTIFAILSIAVLPLLYSFISSNDDNKEAINQEDQEVVMSFSYELNTLTYSQLLDKSRSNELLPHQRFAFVPQKEKKLINGYLNSDGTVNMSIDILEKTKRPVFNILESNPDLPPEIKRVEMNGREIRSFDARGNELSFVESAENEHKQFVLALKQTLNPKDAFSAFLNEIEKEDWKVEYSENTIQLKKKDGNLEMTILYNASTGLPIMSKIISEKQESEVSYKYECRDGKYVLVLQYSRIIKKEADPKIPEIEIITIQELDNIAFNYKN